MESEAMDIDRSLPAITPTTSKSEQKVGLAQTPISGGAGTNADTEDASAPSSDPPSLPYRARTSGLYDATGHEGIWNRRNLNAHPAFIGPIIHVPRQDALVRASVCEEKDVAEKLAIFTDGSWEEGKGGVAVANRSYKRRGVWMGQSKTTSSSEVPSREENAFQALVMAVTVALGEVECKARLRDGKRLSEVNIFLTNRVVVEWLFENQHREQAREWATTSEAVNAFVRIEEQLAQLGVTVPFLWMPCAASNQGWFFASRLSRKASLKDQALLEPQRLSGLLLNLWTLSRIERAKEELRASRADKMELDRTEEGRGRGTWRSVARRRNKKAIKRATRGPRSASITEDIEMS